MKNFVLPLALTLALCACGRESTPPATPAPDAAPTAADAPPSPPATTASAQLAPTQGHTASGTLTLSEEGTGGVRLMGKVEGLPPDGQFGFHIHENGDCSAPDASSAGAHFNPTQQPHGNPEGASHHAGDMLNMRSDAQGMATVDETAGGVTLASGQPNGIVGKAIVVHAKPDDYTTQPSGNSGDRIACGVIVGAG